VGQIDPELDAMQVGYPYVMPLFAEKQKRERETVAEVPTVPAEVEPDPDRPVV
jgi:hypothetical protein